MLATTVFQQKRIKTLTRKRRWLMNFALIACIFSTFGTFSTENAAAEVKKHERVEKHMGCDFIITIFCASSDQAEHVLDLAFNRIRELDASLSNYKTNSELNRVCRGAPHETPVPISDDLYRSLKMSKEMHQLSNGAFDPTIGPITKLWRRARRLKKFPGDKRIGQTMASVGFDLIELYDNPLRVSLTKPKMQLDLGGIAKGFAVDEALSLIKSKGITIACVNGGGDVAVGDSPPGKTGWTIGIAAVSDKLSDRKLILSNRAVATSGDLFQFVEFDGVRYSHIVDPRTGYGLTNSAAVTVVAPTCAMADGLASAISVLGTVQGVALASKLRDVEAMCSELKDTRSGEIQTNTTEGFSRFELSADVKRQ